MKKVYLLLVLTGLFSCFKGQGQLFISQHGEHLPLTLKTGK